MGRITRGILMPNSLRRLVTVAATAALCLPIALRAQQPDDKAQPQAQSNDSATQPKHGRRGMGMRRGHGNQSMAWLAKKLNLTEDQKKQFRNIRQDSMKQAKAIRTDSSLTEDQKREKMHQLRKEQHQQMFSVLTPEQKDQ